jgi:hypothetical protein
MNRNARNGNITPWSLYVAFPVMWPRIVLSLLITYSFIPYAT